MKFMMNGLVWKIVDVNCDSNELIDRSNQLTLATTDPEKRIIYVSNMLQGSMKKRVIAHEMGHAACFSYGLIDEIHRCCYPEHWIYMEEFVCNFVADYGEEIFRITYQYLGDEALYKVPYFLERMVA